MHGELQLERVSVNKTAQPSAFALIEAPLLALTDLLMFALAPALASLLAGGRNMQPQVFFSQWMQLQVVGVYALSALLAVTALWVNGQYSRRRPFSDELRTLWHILGLVVMFNFALFFLAHAGASRTPIVSTWILLFIMLPLGRYLLRKVLEAGGLWRRHVLIIGQGQNAIDACIALQREDRMGLEVIGFGSLQGDRASMVKVGDHAMPVYPLGDQPEVVLSNLGCRNVVIALDRLDQTLTSALVGRLGQFRFDVSVVPSLRGLPVHGVETLHFVAQELLFLRIQNNLARVSSKVMKRILDVIAALFLIVVTSPLLAFVALRIWREDGAPIVFTQRRVGQGGQEFRFLKFRSMVRNADEVLLSWKTANPALYAEYVANNFKLANDPRLISIGAWIRRTSIDELPQLFNVLRGDMSLVGPRPLLARELTDYADEAFYLYALVKPGITGLWQVSGRSKTSFRDRAVLDTRYVRNWSLWQDFTILLKTVRVVFARDGAF